MVGIGERRMVGFKERYRKFIKRFDKEEKCRKHITKRRWGNGFKCPACGYDEFTPLIKKNRDLYQCKKCRKQTSPTAGTIFAKTRTDLTIWFRMIFLVTTERISTRKLQKRLKIKEYKTAWVMRKKIEKILHKSDSAGDAHKELMGLVNRTDILGWFFSNTPRRRERPNSQGEGE